MSEPINYRLGDGWYIGNGDMVARWDWDKSELYIPIGVRVGKVISISEQSIQPPRPMFQSRMAMAEAASSVPIATGEQEVRASINVMYELLD